MRKQKKQITTPIIKSLEELISDYDRPALVKALQMLEHDLSWQILKAALMKEYLSTVAYTLDDVSVTGKQIEAAYKAGVAQTMYDTANSLIDKYKTVIEQRIGVLESVRPDDE